MKIHEYFGFLSPILQKSLNIDDFPVYKLSIRTYNAVFRSNRNIGEPLNNGCFALNTGTVGNAFSASSLHSYIELHCPVHASPASVDVTEPIGNEDASVDFCNLITLTESDECAKNKPDDVAFLCPHLQRHFNIESFPFYVRSVQYFTAKPVAYKLFDTGTTFARRELWKTPVQSTVDVSNTNIANTLLVDKYIYQDSYDDRSLKAIEQKLASIKEVDISDLKAKYSFLFGADYSSSSTKSSKRRNTNIHTVTGNNNSDINRHKARRSLTGLLNDICRSDCITLTPKELTIDDLQNMLTETNSKINFMKELISVKNKNSTMKPCEQSSGSPMCWSPSQSAYTSTQARSHVGSPGHLATLRRASNPDHTPTPHDSPDSTVHFLCRTPMSLAVDRHVADVSTPPYQMHPKTHAAHNSGVFLHGCSPLVTHVLPSEVKCITENNETLKSGKPDYHSAARFRQRVSPLFPQALPVDIHYSDADMSRTAVYKTENTFSEDIFESECPYAIPGLCDSQDCYVNSIETTHAESLALSTSPRLRLEDYNLDYYYKKPEGFIAKPMSPAIPCIYEARDSSGVVYDYSQLQELVDTISYHEHRGDVDSSLHGEIPEDIYSSTISEDEGRKGEADTISFVIRRNVDEVKRAMSHGDLRQNMGSIATVPKSSPFVKGTGELMKEYTNIKGIHKSEYEGGSRPERINVSKYEPTIVHVTNNTFSGDVNCSSLYCDPNDRRQESHRTHDDRYMNHKEAYRKSGVSVDRRFGPYLIEGDGRKRRCSLFRDRSPSYHSERAYFNHRRKSKGRSHECASRKSNECARRRSPKMEKRQSQERTSRRSYERYRERVKRTRYR